MMFLVSLATVTATYPELIEKFGLAAVTGLLLWYLTSNFSKSQEKMLQQSQLQNENIIRLTDAMKVLSDSKQTARRELDEMGDFNERKFQEIHDRFDRIDEQIASLIEEIRRIASLSYEVQEKNEKDRK